MDALLQNPNVRQFLDLIGNAEGANYDTIVGGGTMSDFTAHPNKVGLVTADGPSTAAGRYQIVNSTYQPYAKKLGINDFSPISQDKIALALIADNGALPDVLNGNYQKAVSKLGGTWASLPSSPYSQPKRSNDWVARQVSNPMATNDEWGVKESRPTGQAAPQADEWGVASTRSLAPTASEPAAPSAPEPARGRPTMQNDPRIVNPNAPAPQGVKQLSPIMQLDKKAQEATWNPLQTVDDYVRAAANGLTFGWADRLAAAGDAALGKGDYKSNVKQERAQSEAAHQRNPYGYKATEIGSGLLLPGGVALKGLEKAAPVVGNAAAGALYGGLSGSGAESGDTNLGQAAANTATGVAIGAPTGAVLTPLIGKAAEKLSGVVPMIDQKLTNGYIARTFQNNPTAKVDAEITRDIGLLKNGTDKTIKPQTMNDLQGRYVDEAKTLAKKAGLLDDDVANLTVDRYRSMLADPAKLQQLQSTPAGRALVDNLQKANRTYELTQAIEANNGFIPKTARTLIDSGMLDAGLMASTGLPIPVASMTRRGLAKAFGGNETRTEVINQVGSPRALKAADQFLAENGPSDATKGLGVLRSLDQDMLAKQAAEKAAQERAQGTSILGALTEKEQADAVANMAAQQSKDPTFILGLSNPNGVPRNAKQMKEFSSVLENQMRKRAEEDLIAEGNGVLNKVIEGSTKDVKPSPGFKAMMRREDFKNAGVTQDQVAKALAEVAKEQPELAQHVGQFLVKGGKVSGKTADGDSIFYLIQDSVANKLGVKPLESKGILNSTPVSNQGILSSTEAPQVNITNYVRGLSDDEVKAIIGKDADTAGRTIKNPRKFATGKLEKLMEDVRKGVEIDPQDMALLKDRGLM